MDTLSICQAQSKQAKRRCRNFAVSGRNVCHIHGGKTPKNNQGAKTKEGQRKQKMASWKHGMWSKEAIAERRVFRIMINEYKEVLTKF